MYPQPLEAHVEQLRRRLDYLESELTRLSTVRDAEQNIWRPVSLAQTKAMSGVAYPSSSSATLPIRLIDGTFTLGSGGGRTLNTQSANGQVWANSFTYLPELTYCACFLVNRRYWIFSLSHAMLAICQFTLSAALATSDSSKSATIITASNGATGTITVNNHPTHTLGSYIFAGDSGDKGTAWYDGTDWRIMQMEC